MKKLFVADSGFAREFSRSRAHGHKRLLIDSNIEPMTPIKMETVGDDLVVKKAEETEGNEVFTILCKEFGLVGKIAKFSNKISVIFLDGGWMLVTLLHGAIVCNLEDQLLMPTAGNDFTTPKVVTQDICWVNADNLLEYGKYFKDEKGNFMFDFEFTLIVSGDNVNNMRQMSVKPVYEEDIDLSLGYFAIYQQNKQNKIEAKAAKAFARNLLSTGTDDSSYEFEEDDEETEEGYESDEEDYDDYDL